MTDDSYWVSEEEDWDDDEWALKPPRTWLQEWGGLLVFLGFAAALITAFLLYVVIAAP